MLSKTGQGVGNNRQRRRRKEAASDRWPGPGLCRRPAPRTDDKPSPQRTSRAQGPPQPVDILHRHSVLGYMLRAADKGAQIGSEQGGVLASEGFTSSDDGRERGPGRPHAGPSWQSRALPVGQSRTPRYHAPSQRSARASPARAASRCRAGRARSDAAWPTNRRPPLGLACGVSGGTPVAAPRPPVWGTGRAAYSRRSPCLQGQQAPPPLPAGEGCWEPGNPCPCLQGCRGEQVRAGRSTPRGRAGPGTPCAPPPRPPAATFRRSQPGSRQRAAHPSWS